MTKMMDTTIDDKKHYYRYMGFRDGSGCPQGYVIKYYTHDEYEYYTDVVGVVLIKMD